MKHLTAVVVDDSIMEVEYMARILTDRGVRVVGKCTDGGSGLAAIRMHRPSFAVLDLQLPQLHGSEIARFCQAENIPTAIFIASGSAQKSVKAMCFEYGVKMFVAKPYDDLLTWNAMKPFLEAL